MYYTATDVTCSMISVCLSVSVQKRQNQLRCRCECRLMQKPRKRWGQGEVLVSQQDGAISGKTDRSTVTQQAVTDTIDHANHASAIVRWLVAQQRVSADVTAAMAATFRTFTSRAQRADNKNTMFRLPRKWWYFLTRLLFHIGLN